MRRLGFIVAMLLVAPPAALAQTPSENANQRATVKVCKNTKAQMGARNFNAIFAPRSRNARAALRSCARREAAAQRQARMNAAQTCKTWRNDPAAFQAAMMGTPNQGRTFAQVFGTGRNAHGKCVSTVARQQNAERREDMVNAAQTCRTWKSNPAAFAAAMMGTPNQGRTFAQVYGTGSNASGKCVSQQARAQSGS